METAETSAGWVRELNGTHTPETEEYGIGNFVYRARRPFHPERLEDLTDEGFPNVLRAKGFPWLSSHHDDLILFSIAGNTLSVEPQAHWLAVDSDAEHDPDTPEYIGKVWEAPYGDRRQEIVFIGVQMDRPKFERRLNDALLTNEEMSAGPEGWKRWNDPFAAMFSDGTAIEA